MKKIFKIIIVLLLSMTLIGCTDEESKNNNNNNDVNNDDNIKELLSEYENIILSSNSSSLENSDYSFSILGYSDSINPALTYNSEELQVDGFNVSINLANVLNLRIKHHNNDETVNKIIIRDIEVTLKPEKGDLRFYAIFDGDNATYIDKMREHEIKDEFEYEYDLFGNSKVSTDFNLMFSSTIENIVKTSYEDIAKNTYLDILKNKNISMDDLKVNIKFNVLIYTTENIYALPLEYSNSLLDLYDNQVSDVIFEKPLYFINISK